MSAADEATESASNAPNADLDAVIRQFARRVDRLQRELKDLRAQLEASRARPAAARTA